jgi:hypothetical protein
MLRCRMAPRPDYDRLRAERGFSWHTAATYLALLDVTGIPIHVYNRDPEAGIELFRRGRPAIRDMYGPELDLPAPMTPPVSYGHVNALGLELLFPEGGEVNYVRSDRSMEEWCSIMERPVDWARAGMMPFFASYKEKLERAFPGEKVGLNWGVEGPLTTAYELRDMAVFSDALDEPELFKRFVLLCAESGAQFTRFMNRLRGSPEVSPESAGLVDDVASMFGPEIWERVVLPAWDVHFSGLTTGRRSAHVEDLRPDHLRFLEQAGLWSYDPSISAKLSPRIIAERTRVPFGWRLANFHYPALSESDIHDWVFQAAADGASSVFTYVCATMCTPVMVKKVNAFIAAAKEAKRMVDSGASRAEVGREVSAQGRKRFWSHWP